MSELRLKNYTHFKRLLVPVTFIFPLLFSMGACSEAGILMASFAAIIISLFVSEFDSKALMPTLFNFLIISFLFSTFGSIAATLSLAVGGLVLCFGQQILSKTVKLGNSSVINGIMLGTAIALTVLQTTNYFGIGATGNTVRQMIASYLSLGFHGNWRGVLYGTIVMVILITFPRKFKTASKIISPMFIALSVTLILNLFLNPPDMISAINEAGEFVYNYDSNVSVSEIVISFILGVVIGLTNIYSMSREKCTEKDYIINGLLNIVLSPVVCFIPQKADKAILKNLPGTIILAATIFVFRDFIARIPIHSCAVILIVSAWENVKWRHVKSAFTGGAAKLFLFLLPIIIMLIV